MIRIPEVLDLRVERLAFGGDGIARHDGIVVFVPRTLPGELVRARCVRTGKNLIRARLIEVLSPSGERIEPACPLYGACPGCSYLHTGYRAELSAKQRQLADLLARIGRCAPEQTAHPVAAPERTGYRNKIVLHADDDGGRPVLGYFAEDNRTVFDVPACPLACSAINDKLADLRGDRAFRAGCRAGSSVTLRHTATDGVVWWNSLAGSPPGMLTEATSVGDLAVPPASFFQVNPAVGRLLVEAVESRIREIAPSFVCDAYSGVGVLAFAALRAGAGNAVGIETDTAAVRAARDNAARLGFGKRTGFVAASAEESLARTLASREAEGTLLILDPPRTGLTPETAAAVAASPVPRLIYVSCAADTLARDAARLGAGGFRLTRLRLFDMFPATPHFETIAEFERTKRSTSDDRT
jgi:23S rRNA (uracil1939-C5)-methyltransferase